MSDQTKEKMTKEEMANFKKKVTALTLTFITCALFLVLMVLSIIPLGSILKNGLFGKSGFDTWGLAAIEVVLAVCAFLSLFFFMNIIVKKCFPDEEGDKYVRSLYRVFYILSILIPNAFLAGSVFWDKMPVWIVILIVAIFAVALFAFSTYASSKLLSAATISLDRMNIYGKGSENDA